MQRVFKIALLAVCLSPFLGCGSDPGGLATEHGTMTIEEYEKLAADSESSDEASQSPEDNQELLKD